MKLNPSFTLALCMFPALALQAETTGLSKNTLAQGSGNGSTLFMVKSVQDFNNIVQSHDAVVACIYNPSLTTLAMIQEVVYEIMQVMNMSITCVIISIQDAPTINTMYPFSGPATLISFLHGKKMEQMNIDLQPFNQKAE